MSKIAIKYLLLAASPLYIGSTQELFAQDDGDNGSNDAIIVTARRVEERLQDVPISITVYNQEAISSRNIVNAADLGTYTPSLSVNSRYGPEKASFAIRGFVQDFFTAPSVGVYFADVVGPRGASTTTSGSGVGIGNLFDLHNVQVLKGPQGTLFGRNTTGGAVLVIPQKPTDSFEGYVEGSLGNYDMRRLQGVINIPLADTFKVRVGVDRMKRDGYLRNRSGVGPDRMANTDYIAARLSIVAELTPTLENYTIATYADSDNSGTAFRVVDCKRSNPALPSNGWVGLQFLGGTYGCAQVDRQNARSDGWWGVENSLTNPRVHMQSWQVINTTTWQASDSLTIKNIFSYAEMRENVNLSFGGDNFLNPDGSHFAPVIQIESTPGYDYGAESTMTEELQFQGQHGRLKWQAGGYMERSNPLGYGSQSNSLLINCRDLATRNCDKGYALSIPLSGQTIQVPVGNLGRPFYKLWWRTYGLYAQGTYQLTDQLSVTGGLRYTWDSNRHYQSNVTIQYLQDNTPRVFCTNLVRNPGPNGPGSTLTFTDPNDFRKCDLEFQTKSSAPTWVLDLEYKPTSDLMVFAKWSRGYRAGGVNTPYVFYETWRPEKVDTFEVGAKASFRGAVSGYFNVTGFYNDFRDQQLQATLGLKVGAPGSGGTAIINAGKSRIWGIEMDTLVSLFDDLKLELGYTYLNTKLLSVAGLPPADNSAWVPGASPWATVTATSIEGGPLALSPKNRLQATGTYTLPLDEAIGRISFGATFVYTASQLANTSSPYGVLPSSQLLNLNVGWKDVVGQPIDLSFFATNVTKEKFPLNVGNLYTSFGYESVPVNEPRMWGARLKYRFGS